MGRLRPGGRDESIHGCGPDPAGQPGAVPHSDWLVQTLRDLLSGQRPAWRGQGSGQAGSPRHWGQTSPGAGRSGGPH